MRVSSSFGFQFKKKVILKVFYKTRNSSVHKGGCMFCPSQQFILINMSKAPREMMAIGTAP